MSRSPVVLRVLLCVSLLGSPLAIALAGGGGGSDSSALPGLVGDADYAKAQRAIRRSEWAAAEALLRQTTERFGKEADVYNWLAYVQRKQGKVDAALADYAKALQLNPQHRGALEYRGEAWLMAGNLAAAEQDLATLVGLCGSCEERQQLERAIAAHKAGGTQAASPARAW